MFILTADFDLPVEVKIKGDIKHQKGYTVVSFRERLASNLNIPEENVKFEAVGDGCFIIVFLLPKKVKKTLQLAALNKAHWLTEADVLGIHIKGEEYISLVNTREGKLFPILIKT